MGIIFKQMLNLVCTVLTGRGTPETWEETDSWLDTRIKLFQSYCLLSLSKQSDQNFIHWICLRKRLNREIPHLGNSIFTFNGQPYWDDRVFNETLEERLKSTLKRLEKFAKKEKWISVTHLDSDDAFHKDVIKEIRKEVPGNRKALIRQKGYVYDVKEQRLADWFCESPPFYTIIYPREVFFNPKKKLEYESFFKSHEDIIKVFNVKVMKERRYLVTIHSKNKSTIWNHPFKGKEYSEEESRKILKGFI